MDEKVAVEALRQVKEIFDKYGIEYWLDFGTLLGAVRDGRIIPWDHDIDIGIWKKDFDKTSAACMELRDKGFKIHFGVDHIGIFKYENGEENLISISAYSLDNNAQATLRWIVHPKERYYNGTKLIKRKTPQRIKLLLEYLIWLFSKPVYSGDNPRLIPYKLHVILFKVCGILPTWLGELLTKTLLLTFKIFGCKYLLLSIPSHHFKNLSTINFYGMEFRIPGRTEEYLEYKYGKNWKIPKRDWIYYKEDGAIFKNLFSQ